MKSLQADDNLILLKVVMTDITAMAVFNAINKIDSIVVLRAILFIAFLSPENVFILYNSDCVVFY